MRWFAFSTLKGQVERYQMHEDDLDRINVSLVDWIEMDERTREMKLDFVKGSD